MPITKGGQIHKNLELLRNFKGKVVFITCDYLLGFDLRTSRYGEVSGLWEKDALTKDKNWTYVLHGPFEHHFRTDLQKERILHVIPKEQILSVPLNMAGIADEEFKPLENPPIELLYCGSFRASRVELFKRYFCTPQATNWTISTTQKEKFTEIQVKTRLMGPLPGALLNMLNKSMTQIVISDNMGKTVDDTTPLPFRFWEAASAKSCVFFDSECVHWLENTFNKVSPEFVNSSLVLDALSLEYAIKDLFRDKAKREKHLHFQDEMIKGFNPYIDWQMEKWLK
jgi:hypothetical protein